MDMVITIGITHGILPMDITIHGMAMVMAVDTITHIMHGTLMGVDIVVVVIMATTILRIIAIMVIGEHQPAMPHLMIGEEGIIRMKEMETIRMLAEHSQVVALIQK